MNRSIKNEKLNPSSSFYRKLQLSLTPTDPGAAGQSMDTLCSKVSASDTDLNYHLFSRTSVQKLVKINNNREEIIV